MALIECPDCSQEVSNAAPYCPNCNRPIAQEPVQTVEQTGKGYKLQMILAILLFVVGLISCMAGGGVGASGDGFVGGDSLGPDRNGLVPLRSHRSVVEARIEEAAQWR